MQKRKTKNDKKDLRNDFKELKMKKVKIIFWIFIACIYIFIWVVERMHRTNTGYKVADIKSEVVKKENRNKYLRYKANKLKSIKNIEKEAGEKLNMSLPDPSRIIIVEEDKK